MFKDVNLKTLWLFCFGLVLSIWITISGTWADTTTFKLYVSPSGNDRWSGQLAAPSQKIDGPFQTLERARDRIRMLKKSGKIARGGVTVYLRQGNYERQASFVLTAEDSGTTQSPIIYQAYANEKVSLQGGKRIEGFRPVTNPTILKRLQPQTRSKILELDLKTQGINDYGQLLPRGFQAPERPAPAELFFAERRMQLARFPNTGYLEIADVPAGKDVGKFIYDGDRPQQWQNISDIWLHGYWTYDWADSYTKVKQIDIKTREISTETPYRVNSYKKGGRYYVLNVLEELDIPGEYYIDRTTGILYFYPPSSVNSDRATISTVTEPIISLKDVSDLTLKNLILQDSRGSGIEIIGGKNVLVVDSTIRNLGRNGIEIKGGIQNGVRGSHLYNIGETAIVLEGGDRTSLSPAKHYAENNHINNYGQWVKSYRPAIVVSGVGISVSRNLIHDAPHLAILLFGNDHLIEFNNIYRVCLETADAGAFYMGRDYSQQGNIVRNNYFHNLHNLQKNQSAGDVVAVYLDDGTSGTKVLNNLFYDVQLGVLVGGGRDNLVKSNVFIKTKTSVFIDARILGWAKLEAARGGVWKIVESLEAMNYRKSPYRDRYPKLLNILEDEYGVPKGNEIADNVIFGNNQWLKLLNNLTEKTIKVKGNIVEKDPSFAAAYNPLQPKTDSSASKLILQRIPLKKIRPSPNL